MKILLDECVPKRLGRFFPEHEVVTTPEVGWAGVRNGELLRKASGHFEVFVTVDRNLAFQQNLANLQLPVIVIHAKSNKLIALKQHVPSLQQLFSSPLAPRVHHIGA